MAKKLRWVEDFSMIRGNEVEEIILKLGNAKDFVEQSNQYFIAAAKGLGKTLLLIDKRRDIQNKHSEDRDNKTHTNVHFIPSSEPFLDIMGGERNVSKAEKQFFADLNNAKKVWSFALKLSLFSYRIPDFISKLHGMAYEQAILKKLTGERALNPTDVFRHLFAFLEISHIHSLIDQIDPILERDLALIRDANYIFIDAVDQSISQLTQDSWIHFQAGLVEAAFDLMRSNQHVKVYASIRIEAFVNYSSPTKANVSGYTTKLFYDSSELYRILNHLSGFYEEKSTIEDFLGHSIITKGCNGVQEDPFHYLIRHTLSTPRELVHICRGLSESDDSRLDEAIFRQIVNERSANHLPNIFQELRPILNTLIENTQIEKFLKLLGKNIFNYDELLGIARLFNGYAKDISVELEHIDNPFLDLYNCGLLGYIDNSMNKSTQRFHTPSNPSKTSKLSLPKSDFYFVHPSLQSMIKDQNPNYRIIGPVVIGQNFPWYDWNTSLVQMDELFVQLDEQSVRPIMSKISATLSCTGNHQDYEEALKDLSSVMNLFHQSDQFDDEIKIEIDFLREQFMKSLREHHVSA